MKIGHIAGALRRLMATVAVVVTVSALGGCGLVPKIIELHAAAANGKAATTLRIAAQPYPLYSDVLVAHRLGYIKQELAKVGAAYTWDSFKSGPLVNEAMAAGNNDLGFAADMPAILAKSSGQPIRVVSNVAYGEKALAIMVPSDSTIRSVSELKGKKIAYAKGSYAQHLLALRLSEVGLGLNDIQTVNLGAEDQIPAIENHQVDAIVIWEQYITQLERSGKARVLADGTGVKRGNMVSYATESFLTAHQNVITAYNRAVQRGADLIARDPDKAAKAISGDLKVSVSDLKVIWSHLTFDTKLSDADIRAIGEVKDFALKNDMLTHDFDMRNFIDTQYLIDGATDAASKED